MVESSLHQSEPVMLPGPSFGRMLRGVVGYGLMTWLMIVTPLIVFLPAALMHCALRNGRRIAWAALIVAASLAAVYIIGRPGNPPVDASMTWGHVAGVLLAVALPAMAALPMVERGDPFGRVLMFLLIGSIVGLAVTETGSRALFDYSPYAGQVAQAEQSSAKIVGLYRTSGMPAEMVRFAERWARYSTFVLPAALLVNITLVFVLSLLMIGRLKTWREFVAQRFEPGAAAALLFRNLSLPDWLLFAFVLGGLTPIATGLLQKVAANTLAMVVFLYILQGLAIFRFLLAAMGAGLIGTMLGWLLLVFLTLTGVGPLLLALAGLFDSFFDFRHFKKRKDDSHEGHTD
ncbi:MAG TPA: DUF2232 domain-containing protein [Thermoanaerobaculia bacterium]|jgi:hypothetical protein